MEEKIRVEVIELIRGNGQKFYKCNIDTKEIVEFHPVDNQRITSNRIFIDVQERTLYCVAINYKNALKKFKIQVTEIMRKCKA